MLTAETADVTQAMPPSLLTLAEVGRRLHLTRFTVRKMYKRGEMPKPLLVGKSFRWDAAEIEEWLNSLPHVTGKDLTPSPDTLI